MSSLDSLGFAARYAFFAGIAALVNIGAQWLWFHTYDGPHALGAALAVGTGAGLLVKYVLDKRWIFYDRETRLIARGRQFILYSLMGVGTTVIFWGTEIIFDHIGHGPAWKYLGGAIGLTLGYLTKYRLDKRFVFRSI